MRIGACILLLSSVVISHKVIHRSVLNRLIDRVLESNYDDIPPNSQGEGGDGGQRVKKSIDMYYERRLIKAFNRLYRDLLRG